MSDLQQQLDEALRRIGEIKNARNKACEIAIELQRRLVILERKHPDIVPIPSVEAELWRLKREGYVPLPGDVHDPECRCSLCSLRSGTPREMMRARGDET